jgi:SOS regulatory protein LexA
VSYYDLLKEYIARSGLTLSEISERLEEHGYKVSKGYISQLQNGKTENPATPELNRALALVTGGDVEKLLTAALLEKAPIEIKEKLIRLNKLKDLKSEYDAAILKEDRTQYVTDKFVQVPLLGSVAAGQPIDRVEFVEDVEYAHISVTRGRPVFALRVKGESMIGDYISEGDIIICVSQKEVSPNDIAVVAVDNETATIKRVKYDGAMCMLIPSNPRMQPSLFDSSRVEIIGKIVEVRRRMD